MLAAEFGYTREYVDKYINTPSLRSLLQYRQDCPPAGLMVRLVFSDKKNSESVGPRKRKQFKETSSVLVDSLNAEKIPDENFTKMLDIIDRPADY
jgi:hypothetical protein